MASENKSQFVSRMSHELRTPLNAIIGLTEMMVKNAARFGTEKAQEPLQRVNRAGTHLLGLINQVLDLSKIEAGKLELNPQTVQLAPLINEVIGTAGQLAEQNKNRLVVDAPENLGALTVDPCGCGRYCSISSAMRAFALNAFMMRKDGVEEVRAAPNGIKSLDSLFEGFSVALPLKQRRMRTNAREAGSQGCKRRLRGPCRGKVIPIHSRPAIDGRTMA